MWYPSTLKKSQGTPDEEPARESMENLGSTAAPIAEQPGSRTNLPRHRARPVTGAPAKTGGLLPRVREASHSAPRK